MEKYENPSMNRISQSSERDKVVMVKENKNQNTSVI